MPCLQLAATFMEPVVCQTRLTTRRCIACARNASRCRFGRDIVGLSRSWVWYSTTHSSSMLLHCCLGSAGRIKDEIRYPGRREVVVAPTAKDDHSQLYDRGIVPSLHLGKSAISAFIFFPRRRASNGAYTCTHATHVCVSFAGASSKPFCSTQKYGPLGGSPTREIINRPR